MTRYSPWPPALEGHPDNVAACLAGGLTIAWIPEAAAGVAAGQAAAGQPRLVRLPVLEEIRPVVLVPDEVLATATARGALPPAVPHRDAAANAARSALLVAALTRVPDVLFDATQDYLHQSYRAAAAPPTADAAGPAPGGGGARGRLRGRPVRARAPRRGHGTRA